MRRSSASELFIAQRINALTRTLSGVRQGDVPSIHQARVATRRLREALPLIGSGRSRRGLARGVKRLTRALGPVRELDVALLMLEELEASAAAPRPAVVLLRRVVSEERERLHADLLARLDRVDAAKIRKKAMAAVRRGGHVAASPKRLADAHARVADRAARLRAAVDNAAGLYLPDRLHEVRIAVKKLRYSMEVARDLSGSRAAARILALKRSQDLLGRMHDLEVLIARTRGVQSSAKAPTLRMSGDLDRLVRHLETECRQLHGKYMASRASLLRICDRALATGDPKRRDEPAA